MRHPLCAPILVALAAAGAPRLHADTYPRQPGISITRYAFDVTLTDTSSEISVTEVVDLRFTTNGVTSVDLDLCGINPARTPGAIVDQAVPQPAPVAGNFRARRIRRPQRRG